MNRVKYESTTTGTGALTLTVPTGFQAITSSYLESPTNLYMIVDGNGTDWEFGYGVLGASSLTRTGVIESTNGNALVSLSANTHSVFLTRAGLEGGIVQNVYGNSSALSIAATTYNSSITFNQYYQGYDQFNGLEEMPGASAPSLPFSNAPFHSALSYAKGYRLILTLELQAPGASGEFIGAQIELQDNSFTYVYSKYENWVPIVSGQNTVCSVVSPIVELKPCGTDPGFGDRGAWQSHEPYFKVSNSSGNPVNYAPRLDVEWYL